MIISLRLRLWNAEPNTTAKIACIKRIKDALNCGLAEAKMLVDAAAVDYTPIFVSSQQFARLYQLHYTGEAGIDEYAIVDSVPAPFDFTAKAY